MGPQSKAAYQGMESGLGARQAAHVEAIKRANEEARKRRAQQAATGSTTLRPSPPGDAWS